MRAYLLSDLFSPAWSTCS